MIVSVGHGFYWAGAGGAPPSVAFLHEYVKGTMQSMTGRTGGMRHFLRALRLVLAARLEKST